MTTSKQSSTASQSQSGTIDPWQPSQGSLNSILNGIGGINYQPTQAQYQALGTIANNANSMPNYGQQAEGITNSLLGGGQDYSPYVTGSYNQYQGAVNPLLSGSLDPMQTPGLSDALSTIRNDVGNSVNGMFAGAGRDLSGLNQQSLARGIAQGEAPVIVGQYNQNVANRMNAANGLLGAGQATAGALSGLQQTQFGNQLQGLNTGINTVPSAVNANANQALQAASQSYGLPVQNLAQLEALTVPIAGLGRNYSGTANSQSDSSSTASPLSAALGVFGTLFPKGLSDRRAKDDIREVGALHDGQKVYSYRYKGDDETRIGLMADEVQKRVPQAVGPSGLGGLMSVDYRMATNNAAKKAGK